MCNVWMDSSSAASAVEEVYHSAWPFMAVEEVLSQWPL